MAKYLVLDLIMASFGPDLVPSFFSGVLHLLDLLYAILKKTDGRNLRKWQKT